MYTDDYGRAWEGPFPFTAASIAANAPRLFGVYEVLYAFEESLVVGYIGIATGDSIFGRLSKHVSQKGNWALGRLSDVSQWSFVYYRCDPTSAAQIESFVVTNAKPPFNVRSELKNLIPSIAVH